MERIFCQDQALRSCGQDRERLPTHRVREAAGDDDVPGPVVLLALLVHHQQAQLQPGPGDPGDDLAVVLQRHVLPLHLHDPVPQLETPVVGRRVFLHTRYVTLT